MTRKLNCTYIPVRLYQRLHCYLGCATIITRLASAASVSSQFGGGEEVPAAAAAEAMDTVVVT